jgi:Uma2 family endonuclease
MSAVLEQNQLKLTKSEVIYGVSWEMYELLIEKYWGENTPRLTYDSGIMEVEVSNSLEHEIQNRNLARLVEIILLELEIDFRNGGSTTFTKKTVRKGFEPDTCFYIESIPKIAGKSNLGIENTIPPDLIIEINRTSSSVPRMPVFAAFGVKEVWRFNKNEVKFYTLEDKVYLETKTSFALPILSSEKATELLLESRNTGNLAWVKKIKDWIKETSK